MLGAFAIASVTYAVYSSTGSGTGSVSVAKWAVKLNSTDITGASNSFTITFSEKTANYNVVAGKVAPGSEMVANFEIDPTGSEVSMTYSFELGSITKTGSSGENAPTNFTISKVCKVNGSTETTLTPNDGKYSGDITLTNRATLTASDIVSFKVYIQWTATDDNTTNQSDTEIGVSPASLEIPVTCNVKQKIA